MPGGGLLLQECGQAGDALHTHDTVCPGSSDPFYIVTYYKNWSLLPRHAVSLKKSILI